jgi:hypothetical protein
MASLNFNIDDLPQSTSNYEPLPPGWYTVNIRDAELKPTKDGAGQYIKIQYKLDNGRVVFGNLNIKNASPKAEEIGRQQLGELMRALGLSRVTDSDQLIGGNLQIKLAVKEAANGFEASNDVKGYKAIDGSMPVAPAAPSPAAAASKAPPWAKK